MAKLKKFDLSGKELGTVDVSDVLVKAEANGQMIKDYIVALRANLRQWSASTKTRTEVKHTNKKPRPQKKTGRARAGSLVSPQFRGGGIVFGPKPKFDQHVRINRKERKAAIRFLLAEKIKAHHLFIIEDTAIKEPKTKQIAAFLKACGVEGKRVLFLGEGHYAEFEAEGKSNRVSIHSHKHHNFALSMRNIQKAEFALAMNINGYDILLARDIFMTEAALNEVTQWLS